MRTRKYQSFQKALKGLSRNRLIHQKLLVLSQMYIDIDQGFRFSYMPDENGEIEFISRLSELYSNDFLFFDVGAHIGTYTDMVLNTLSNYQGYLFEPTTDSYKNCVNRLGNNKRLRIENAALSDNEGEIDYIIYPGDPTRNGIAGGKPEVNFHHEIKKVPCLIGDAYCKKNNINQIQLLKIDAEGYDLHVIKGFERMLSKTKIDIIQFEYNIKSSITHSMLGDYYYYLESLGYVLGVIRQRGVDFKDFDFTQNNFKSGPNYIACKKDLKYDLARF